MADEARVETQKQQNIAATWKYWGWKSTHGYRRHKTIKTKEANNYPGEAKVILLKTKKDSEEARAKFKLEAQQAMAI